MDDCVPRKITYLIFAPELSVVDGDDYDEDDSHPTNIFVAAVMPGVGLDNWIPETIENTRILLTCGAALSDLIFIPTKDASELRFVSFNLLSLFNFFRYCGADPFPHPTLLTPSGICLPHPFDTYTQGMALAGALIVS